MAAIRIPYLDKISDIDSLIERPWQNFFRSLLNIVEPLGSEKTFDLFNNQAAALFIKGFSFDVLNESQVFIDYNIQRTTSTNELVEAGTLRAVYLPKTKVWNLGVVGTSGPNVSGVTFSITTDGFVKYTSTNVGGTPITFKVSIRSRSLSGKNNL